MAAAAVVLLLVAAGFVGRPWLEHRQDLASAEQAIEELMPAFSDPAALYEQMLREQQILIPREAFVACHEGFMADGSSSETFVLDGGAASKTVPVPGLEGEREVFTDGFLGPWNGTVAVVRSDGSWAYVAVTGQFAEDPDGEGLLGRYQRGCA